MKYEEVVNIFLSVNPEQLDHAVTVGDTLFIDYTWDELLMYISYMENIPYSHIKDWLPPSLEDLYSLREQGKMYRYTAPN